MVKQQALKELKDELTKIKDMTVNQPKLLEYTKNEAKEETNMNWKIAMTAPVYDKVFTLMEHNKKLNDGNEIGAWLTGDWKLEGQDATLILDNFVIPKQKVSGAEVDISPESMVDTIKTLGIEESNRIKAHWHIHPFGKGETNWSGTDEEKIKDFMLPEKNREVWVFLLSSLDQIFARVETRLRTSMLGKQIILSRSFDKLPVEKLVEENKTLLDELEAVIKEKVETTKYTYKGKDEREWYGHWHSGKAQHADAEQDEDPYTIHVAGNRVHLKMTNQMVTAIQPMLQYTALLGAPTKKKIHGRHETWKYDPDGDFLDTNEIVEQLELDLAGVMYEDYMEGRDSGKTLGNLAESYYRD